MSPKTLAVGALLASGGAMAQCDTLNANFVNESTRVVLTTLAAEAGLRIANPEVISGKINAEFEDEVAAKLFPKVAWGLGYELRIQGDQVWLKPLSKSPASGV